MGLRFPQSGVSGREEASGQACATHTSTHASDARTQANTHTRAHTAHKRASCTGGVRSKWESAEEQGEEAQGLAWVWRRRCCGGRARSHAHPLPYHSPFRELGAVTQGRPWPLCLASCPCGLLCHPHCPPPGPPFLTWSDSSKHRQRVVSESHARGAALRGEGTAEVQLS